MHPSSRRRHQRGRSLALTLLLSAALGGALVVLLWFGTRSGSGAMPAPESVATPMPNANQADLDARGASEQADAAVREQRLFAPAGDNAFELYLAARDKDPDAATLATHALAELYPYAVMHVEQRLAAGDTDDAGRVLDLMRRADARAPALPRLDTALAALRERTRAAAEGVAAARAAPREPTPVRANPEPLAAAPRTEPDTAPSPRPVARPVIALAAPAPRADAAEPTSASSAAASAPTARASNTADSVALTATLPPIVDQVPARYPTQALRRRIQGRVELQFTIATDGRVSDVSVLRAEPEGFFEREAVGAMQRWRFAPTGREIRARRVFDFRLDDAG